MTNITHLPTGHKPPLLRGISCDSKLDDVRDFENKITKEFSMITMHYMAAYANVINASRGKGTNLPPN